MTVNMFVENSELTTNKQKGTVKEVSNEGGSEFF